MHQLALIAMPIVLAVLKVGAVGLIGYLLARRGVLHETALADLSNLVISVTVPCLIFANAAGGFTGISLSSALLPVLGGPVVIALGYGVGRVMERIWAVEFRRRRAVIAATTFANSAYLPIAVATGVLPPLASHFPPGPATQAAAIAGTSVISISLFGVFYSPLFWGLGLGWLQGGTRHGLPQGVPWARLLPPPVIGVIVGYLFGLTPLHRALTRTNAPLHFLFLAISDIGNLTIPLANLILGGMLVAAVSGRSIRIGEAAGVALGKLLLVPGATLALLWLGRRWWIHDAPLALGAFVVFLEGLTPPATNLAVMSKRAERGGVANEAVAAIPGLLLIAYPLSMLTMPLWLILFFHLLGQR